MWLEYGHTCTPHATRCERLARARTKSLCSQQLESVRAPSQTPTTTTHNRHSATPFATHASAVGVPRSCSQTQRRRGSESSPQAPETGKTCTTVGQSKSLRMSRISQALGILRRFPRTMLCAACQCRNECASAQGFRTPQRAYSAASAGHHSRLCERCVGLQHLRPCTVGCLSGRYGRPL